MITDKIRELAATRAKLERLERTVEAALPEALARLPGQFGFDDLGAFIAALQEASGGKGSGRPGTGPGRPAKAGRKRRSRAVITGETRAQVKKLARAGKTGAEIARAVGISLPSVQNIKKALGLVKARGAKAAPKARKASRKPKAAGKAAAAAADASAPEAPKA